MYATETPILESVFVTHAPDAVSIKDLAEGGMPDWFWSALSYRELLEWVEES